MEPKFQTSFIPKKPISLTQSGVLPVARSFNLFSLLATVFFIVTLLTSGGLFIYQKILDGQIIQAGKDIEKAREAFQVGQIKDLIDANSRIKAAETLLENHVVISRIMVLLEELTVKRIRFYDFSYSNKNNSPTLAMKAESQGYNALAVQGEIFSKSEFLRDSRFFDFTAGDNGIVTASFYTTLNPELISYKKAVGLESTNQ